jgi:hypothetical protein
MEYRTFGRAPFYLPKGGEQKMLINLGTLNQMFACSPDKSHLSFKSCCQSCGGDVTIDIYHLPSGYGLSGGAIYEAGFNRLLAKCEKCYQISHELAKPKE